MLSRADWKLLRKGKEIADGHIGDLPFVEEPIRLHPRDLLVLTKDENRAPAPHGDLPHISCTLPEVFTTAKAGQPIFFDDGKIEGRICEVHPDHMLVEILHTGAGEAKLGSAKGINLPDTDLGIGAMTEKDRRDLDFVANMPISWAFPSCAARRTCSICSRNSPRAARANSASFSRSKAAPDSINFRSS